MGGLFFNDVQETKKEFTIQSFFQIQLSRKISKRQYYSIYNKTHLPSSSSLSIVCLLSSVTNNPKGKKKKVSSRHQEPTKTHLGHGQTWEHEPVFLLLKKKQDVGSSMGRIIEENGCPDYRSIYTNKSKIHTLI